MFFPGSVLDNVRYPLSPTFFFGAFVELEKSEFDVISSA